MNLNKNEFTERLNNWYIYTQHFPGIPTAVNIHTWRAVPAAII